MTWHRAIDSLWLPDARDNRGALWLYEAVMSKKYPSWNRVVDTMKNRIYSFMPEPELHENALALASGLPRCSVASVTLATGRRWSISTGSEESSDGSEEGPVGISTVDVNKGFLLRKPSSSKTEHATPGRAKLLRDWKTGKGHRAFLEL